MSGTRHTPGAGCRAALPTWSRIVIIKWIPAVSLRQTGGLRHWSHRSPKSATA